MLIQLFDATEDTSRLCISRVLATGNINSIFNQHAFSILPKVTRPDGIYGTAVHLPSLHGEEVHQQASTSLWSFHEEVRSRARMFLSLVLANLS